MKDTALSLKDTVEVSGNAIFRELDGEAVILDLDSGTYFGLNSSGTRMWNLLVQQHGTLQRVLEALEKEYEAAPETLRDDLLQLVRQLQQKGLVRVSAVRQ